MTRRKLNFRSSMDNDGLGVFDGMDNMKAAVPRPTRKKAQARKRQNRMDAAESNQPSIPDFTPSNKGGLRRGKERAQYVGAKGLSRNQTDITPKTGIDLAMTKASPKADQALARVAEAGNRAVGKRAANPRGARMSREEMRRRRR